MDTKETSKEILLEDIISASVQVPGVKVDRNKFLAEQFVNADVNIQDIVDFGPSEAGVSKEVILHVADKLIVKRTSQSSIASFVAGMPGGLAMAATIPADIMQFFAMALRLAQELSYLYGAQDLWVDGKVDDERVKSQLVMYCGVMFGVSGAVSGVRVLSTQIAKTTLKKLPQKALTKTFWYPILKQIGKAIGVKVTKVTLASGISKTIPVVGGVISGGLNFASMLPMAKRLNDALYKATFDYSEDEFYADIEVVENIGNEDIILETADDFADIKQKVYSGFNNAKAGIHNIASKLDKNNKIDPYEEVKKLKELLDIGAITQEEFDAKKKELLNL